YDVKFNGFVRAEPAYVPTGNEPANIAFMNDLEFFAAIAQDKEEHRAATRKPKAEYVGVHPGELSGELTWDDWHEDDGLPVKGFTCDYEDALTIAGQLRNYFEHYEEAAQQFLYATYDSDDYAGTET